MKYVKSILWSFIFFGFLGIMSPVVLISLISEKLTGLVFRFIINSLLFFLKYTIGLDYRVYGDIPRNAIFLSKHMSTMDVMLLSKLIKKPVFVLKKELTFIPVYGWMFLRLGYIPLDRKKGAKGMRIAKLKIEQRIKQGYDLVIFPEGTRVHIGESNRFKRGILFFAEDLNVPIIPVGLNTGKFWQKNQFIKKYGTADIYFEKPVKLDFDEIVNSIQKHSI